MANPTAAVASYSVPVIEEKFSWPLASTAQTYYVNEMIGLNESGYATKFDDTQSMLFLGLMTDLNRIVVDSGGSNGDYNITVVRPARFLATITSAALTDVGKLVYAKYSNEVQFSGSTYANVVGRVWKRVSSTTVEVIPAPLFARGGCGAGRVLAATGTQTLSKYDLNKTIFLPNTAAHTVNLPAVADTQAGDWLRFVKTTSDAQAVTLDGNASETIDGATTLATIDAQYDTALLVSNGSVWVVASRDIA